MPLFFQQPVNSNTQLAIWKIEEDEAFFMQQVPLQRSITHPHKRLQHLAGRYLLKFLFPDFPLELIQIADTRKPFLADELFHFSISHCGDFAAVIVSRHNRVGVDIELVTDKVRRIQHKFVSDAELQLLDAPFVNNRIAGLATQPGGVTVNERLILAWSGKEAVFKWHGASNVDFKKHMQLQRLETADNKLFQMSICFKKEEDRLLGLQSRFFNNLCLSYIFT